MKFTDILCLIGIGLLAALVLFVICIIFSRDKKLYEDEDGSRFSELTVNPIKGSVNTGLMMAALAAWLMILVTDMTAVKAIGLAVFGAALAVTVIWLILEYAVRFDDDELSAFGAMFFGAIINGVLAALIVNALGLLTK